MFACFYFYLSRRFDAIVGFLFLTFNQDSPSWACRERPWAVRHQEAACFLTYHPAALAAAVLNEVHLWGVGGEVAELCPQLSLRNLPLAACSRGRLPLTQGFHQEALHLGRTWAKTDPYTPDARCVE